MSDCKCDGGNDNPGACRPAQPPAGTTSGPGPSTPSTPCADIQPQCDAVQVSFTQLRILRFSDSGWGHWFVNAMINGEYLSLGSSLDPIAAFVDMTFKLDAVRIVAATGPTTTISLVVAGTDRNLDSVGLTTILPQGRATLRFPEDSGVFQIHADDGEIVYMVEGSLSCAKEAMFVA